MRSKLESTQRRAVERSLSQLQELADSLAKASLHANRRIEYFYVSRIPLECELQNELAEVLKSLGAISSALDIYIRLQLWEGVIACYQQLDRKHKVNSFFIDACLSGVAFTVLLSRPRKLSDKNWQKRKHPSCGVYLEIALMM